MKKITIITAMALWICVAIRILNGALPDNDTIEAAFKSVQFDNISATVEAFGDYGITHLTNEEKENLLYNVASCIGITRPCQIYVTNNEGRDVTELVKLSDNGKVSIQVLTDNTMDGSINVSHQYISINIQIYNHPECATSYKELVKNIFDADGIEGKVNIYLKGESDGALNYEERNNVADKMLSILGAEVIAQSREEDVFTIYAYTDAIEEYIVSAGEKININIAAKYDENNNKTVIYLATPMNNLDY